jgi:hypothetical protein
MLFRLVAQIDCGLILLLSGEPPYRYGKVSDFVTILINTYSIGTLQWASSTLWADAAAVPLAWVNICDTISYAVALKINLSQGQLKYKIGRMMRTCIS